MRTVNEAEQIRNDAVVKAYRTGKFSQEYIATLFNVTQGYVSHLVRKARSQAA